MASVLPEVTSTPVRFVGAPLAYYGEINCTTGDSKFYCNFKRWKMRDWVSEDGINWTASITHLWIEQAMGYDHSLPWRMTNDEMAAVETLDALRKHA